MTYREPPPTPRAPAYVKHLVLGALLCTINLLMVGGVFVFLRLWWHLVAIVCAWLMQLWVLKQAYNLARRR